MWVFVVYTLNDYELQWVGKYLGRFSVNVEFENGVQRLRPHNVVVFQLEIRGHTTGRSGTDGDCKERWRSQGDSRRVVG
jgi:hypothetical protein